MRMEHIWVLKHSKSVSFRALKFSRLESCRIIKSYGQNGSLQCPKIFHIGEFQDLKFLYIWWMNLRKLLNSQFLWQVIKIDFFWTEITSARILNFGTLKLSKKMTIYDKSGEIQGPKTLHFRDFQGHKTLQSGEFQGLKASNMATETI